MTTDDDRGVGAAEHRVGDPADKPHDRRDDGRDDGSDLDFDDDPVGPPSLWWAVHRPETYALAALTLAVATLLGLSPAYEIVQAFLLNGNGNGDRGRLLLGIPAGIRLGVALLAIGLAVASIRSDDEDTTWSAPVSRAALVIAVLAAALALTTLIGLLVADTPQTSGFTVPSQ